MTQQSESSLAHVYARMVKDVPALRRGTVWCRQCGASLLVDSAECLRRGWPKCCSATMTIDSPEERKARNYEQQTI